MSEREIPEVYRQTIGPLYAFVSRRCGGERPLAEDVVQETWLRAVDAWRRDGMPHEPSAWLTTVARNLLVSHFRRRKPVALDAIAAETTLAAVDDGFPTESVGSVQMIHWGLAQLPASQAGILEAFHLDERPTAAIARELRVSERAVEGRLRRARLKLRRLLERTIHKQGSRR